MNVSQARIMRIGPVPVSVKTFFYLNPIRGSRHSLFPRLTSTGRLGQTSPPSPGPSLTST